MVTSGTILSQKDLGAKMGYANESTISQIINGKVKEPKDFIDRLASFIPDLNKVWLETGEGAMLNSDALTRQETLPANHEGNASCILEREFLDEIAAQRRLLEKSQEQLGKSQEQIDRLISIIERMNERK